MGGFLKEDRRDDARTHTQNENQINWLLDIWTVGYIGLWLLFVTFNTCIYVRNASWVEGWCGENYWQTCHAFVELQRVLSQVFNCFWTKILLYSAEYNIMRVKERIIEIQVLIALKCLLRAVLLMPWQFEDCLILRQESSKQVKKAWQQVLVGRRGLGVCRLLLHRILIKQSRGEGGWR